MNKVVIGVQNGDQLRDKMMAVSWTATKKKWTDLPEKLYTVREHELTSEQKQMYNKMFRDMVIEVKEKVLSVTQAVHKYSKLQQITSGFVYDTDESEPVSIMDFNKVPKVKLLDEILDEIDGKVIIFGHYRPTIEALQAHLKCNYIKGGMKEAEIEHQKAEFNYGKGQCLVAQSAAAKYGLTLLGNEDMPCHTTIYFENNYSLDARIQSEDRNHRHGQKNPVLYIDLAGTNVERRIIKALQDKNNMSKAIQDLSNF